MQKVCDANSRKLVCLHVCVCFASVRTILLIFYCNTVNDKTYGKKMCANTLTIMIYIQYVIEEFKTLKSTC